MTLSILWDFRFKDVTLNNKILQLPSEQKSWLLLMRDIYKRSSNSNNENEDDLFDVIEKRAIERGYNQIKLLFDTKELKKYLIK